MSAPYLTPAQLAGRWLCSAGYVRTLCRSGELRALQLGTSWRISQEAVAEYEARHTTAAAATDRTEPHGPVRVETPVALVALPDLPDLPADYEPVFPELWPTHAARPVARRGGSASKRTARLSG